MGVGVIIKEKEGRSMSEVQLCKETRQDRPWKMGHCQSKNQVYGSSVMDHSGVYESGEIRKL